MPIRILFWGSFFKLLRKCHVYLTSEKNDGHYMNNCSNSCGDLKNNSTEVSSNDCRDNCVTLFIDNVFVP